MQNEVWAADTAFMDSLCGEYRRHNQIDPADYERYQVKRGLRNPDGTGVMAGVTQIGSVMGYYVQDGERAASALRRRPTCCSWAPCPPGRSWRASRPC